MYGENKTARKPNKQHNKNTNMKYSHKTDRPDFLYRLVLLTMNMM